MERKGAIRGKICEAVYRASAGLAWKASSFVYLIVDRRWSVCDDPSIWSKIY